MVKLLRNFKSWAKEGERLTASPAKCMYKVTGRQDPLTLTAREVLISDQNILQDKPLLTGKQMCKCCTWKRRAWGESLGGELVTTSGSHQIPTDQSPQPRKPGLFKYKAQRTSQPVYPEALLCAWRACEGKHISPRTFFC